MNSKKTLLEWLGCPARESTSRDLLGWAIQENGLLLLAPILGNSAPTSSSFRVHSEHVFTSNDETPKPGKSRDRIDLLVDAADCLVGIEVKVHSGAGAGQLERYAGRLAEQAAGRPCWLVFLTETGAVPEYPRELEKRHPSVSFVYATWDSLVTVLPAGDPLGWHESLTRRQQDFWEWERRLLGSGTWPTIPKMTAELANAASRGVLALAKTIGTKVGLEHVHGPVGGDYYPDPQVDLAKSNWTVPLGFHDGALAPYNPFADGELRLAVRARFRMNGSGALTLGIGTGISPYPPHTSSWKQVEIAAASALDRAWAIRTAIRQIWRKPQLKKPCSWSLDQDLVTDWSGEHVTQATEALKGIIPRIDEVLASFSEVGVPR